MRVTHNSTNSSVTDLASPSPALDGIPIPTGAQRAPVTRAASGHEVAVSGLTKRFGDNLIFSDVSFQLARGEAAALVGANGTGKSTLLRCVLGLIPATNGRIMLFDEDLSAAKRTSLRRLRAKTGLVSQKHNLVPRVSVLSNVVHGLLGAYTGPRFWTQAFTPADARERAMQALDKVGLSHLAMRRADRLSGGQSQRVAIARALVCEPSLLIADEPCASLDPAAGEEVMALFFQLVREDGVTVIFTSHHIDHALAYGDRVLGLAGGRLKLDAPAGSLATRDLRDLYV